MFSRSFCRSPVGPILAVLSLVAPHVHAQTAVQVYRLIDLSAGRFAAAGTPAIRGVQSGQITTFATSASAAVKCSAAD